MELIKLEYHHYDEDDCCDDVVTFEVPKTWLIEFCDFTSTTELDEFLENYCSDDTQEIYSFAVLNNVIQNEVHFC